MTKEELTYNKLIAQIVDLSVSLKKLGVEVGDVIGVGSESRNEFVPAIIAIISTGAIYSPLDITCGKGNKPKLFHKYHVICE